MPVLLSQNSLFEKPLLYTTFGMVPAVVLVLDLEKPDWLPDTRFVLLIEGFLSTKTKPGSSLSCSERVPSCCLTQRSHAL
jgi:hypothetical protein